MFFHLKNKSFFAAELMVSFLSQLYLQHNSQVRGILGQLPTDMVAYQNLEWRLDVQVQTYNYFPRLKWNEKTLLNSEGLYVKHVCT